LIREGEIVFKRGGAPLRLPLFNKENQPDANERTQTGLDK
jgi:hypothetical protein